MSYCVVWVDHEHAKIFKFMPGSVQKSEVKKHGSHHHAGHHTSEDKNHVHKLYQDLAHALQDSTEILIVGDGVAKTEFKHYLENHNDKKLVSKVVGVETMDKATDKEIEIKARKFFTKVNLFN
jgi:stalled ribosome rescue protein Dom34